MRRFLGAALAAALVLSVAVPVVAAPAPDVEGSIALSFAPTYGGPIWFTETYPQEAAKQARQNQYPGSPQTQVKCWQSGEPVWFQLLFPADRTKIPGGWLAMTNEMTLLGRYPGGATWEGGAAECVAILFSNDSHGQYVWAILWFEVGP